jgi:hypothetical protein
MKDTAILFLFLLFFLSARSQNISVSKSTQSIQTGTIEISSPAIPVSEAGNIEIDSATYHQAVVIGSEPDRDETVIQISAPAISPSAHIHRPEKKEKVNDLAPGQSGKNVRGTVPLKAAAMPR